MSCIRPCLIYVQYLPSLLSLSLARSDTQIRRPIVSQNGGHLDRQTDRQTEKNKLTRGQHEIDWQNRGNRRTRTKTQTRTRSSDQEREIRKSKKLFTLLSRWVCVNDSQSASKTHLGQGGHLLAKRKTADGFLLFSFYHLTNLLHHPLTFLKITHRIFSHYHQTIRILIVSFMMFVGRATKFLILHCKQSQS